MARVVAELGPPDVVCNIAGIGKFQHSTDVTLAEWDRIVGVNLTGTFLVCRATLPYLLDRDGLGRVIVNVASTAAILPQPYSAAYCASKAGVVMLTKALAFEYRRRNVRINAIAPGGIDTPMIGSWGYPEGAPYEDFSHMVSALGFCQPEEVASTIAYLASDEARYMTGSVVTIDGGISM
jgi:NAD(P)-dependent dehydrogenase (short-subunit alcohol dehydrogenase family)